MKVQALLIAALALNCSLCPDGPNATPGPGTDEFLDEQDFVGSYKPLGGPTKFGGEAIFNGRIVFANLPRTLVDDVLPADLRLAAPATTVGTAQTHHPVAMSWGHQTQTKIVYPFWTPEVGDNYQEMILIIPFVLEQNGTRWHNYIVRMYVNDDYAHMAGNLYYGVRKRMAAFFEPGAEFDVRESNHPRFKSTASVPANWLTNAQAEQTLNNYQDMKKIWSMPVLGTLTYSPGEPRVCSYFEWDFSHVEVSPIDTTHHYQSEFVSNMSGWVAAGPITSVTEGAWEVRGLRWRMGFPALMCEY